MSQLERKYLSLVLKNFHCRKDQEDWLNSLLSKISLDNVEMDKVRDTVDCYCLFGLCICFGYKSNAQMIREEDEYIRKFGMDAFNKKKEMDDIRNRWGMAVPF